VDERAGEVRVGGRVFREGDWLSIDGTAGEILAGSLTPFPSEIIQTLLSR
jgi:pyruvate,orthophosphate dikinase